MWVYLGRFFAWKPFRASCLATSYLLVSIYVDIRLHRIYSSSLKTAKTKQGPTLKSSHQQLSSHLALSSHMLNEFILPIPPVVENSDVNSYAMGLVATQRPETKCFHLEQFCEWLCLLLLVGDRWPLLVRTLFFYSPELYFDSTHPAKKEILCYEWKWM